MWLSKPHDLDQDVQNQDEDRQQIDVVRQPRFLCWRWVCQEGRHEFLGRRGRGSAQFVGRCGLLLLDLLDLLLLRLLLVDLLLFDQLLPGLTLRLLLFEILLFRILLLTIEAESSPLGNGESAGSAFLHPEHGLWDCSGRRLQAYGRGGGFWRRNYGWLGGKDCGLSELWFGKLWFGKLWLGGLWLSGLWFKAGVRGDVQGNVEGNRRSLWRAACPGRFDRLFRLSLGRRLGCRCGRERGRRSLALLGQIQGSQREAGHALERDQIALFKSVRVIGE